MSGLEDRLRDALHASAGRVDADKPRPFPERGPRRFPERGPRRGAPMRRWMVPVCAVLAVIALAAGIVGVRKMMEPDRRLQKVPTMPRFYFASYLAGGGEPSRVEVRESRTGRLLDAKSAPKGTNFLDLAAAGDGRTLFLFARQGGKGACASTIHRLSLNDHGEITGDRRVPGGAVSGSPVGSGSLAVGADGRRLAYSVESCTPEPETGKMSAGARIGVLDVASGARREWRESQSAADQRLAWAGDGDRLFFVRSWYGSSDRTIHELRSLRVSGGAKQPTAGSLIRRITSPRAFEGVTASEDGRRVFVLEGSVGAVSAEAGAGAAPDSDGGFDVLELSAEDGSVVRSIKRRSSFFAGDAIMKSDPSGRYLLTAYGLVDLGKPDGVSAFRVGEGFYDLDW
ncbi:hypothetical protein ACIBI3_09630 [Actinomadura luteofluorescens]|uniref:hypothetical protein n=1 Tax=Actinomadura luteofluorescens TaxID=46163 RepID=UPI00347CB7F2